MLKVSFNGGVDFFETEYEGLSERVFDAWRNGWLEDPGDTLWKIDRWMNTGQATFIDGNIHVEKE